MEVEHLALDALLVEDNPGDAQLIQHHLSAPHVPEIAGDVSLEHVESLTAGLDALETRSHDILFLDLGLPESTGLDTLETVLEAEPRIPIVVLTGLDDRETAVNAIKHGAQDYLPKDNLDADLLAWAVRYAVERHRQEEALRRQNERLDEFASIVSHDLRNPLNVAMGRIDLAQSECESEHLDTVEKSLDRMAALIDDLRTLARQGQSVDEFDAVAVGALAERCWETVETDDATLVVETDVVVRADESRLRQLLENLIRNAIEHGGEGVTITIGALDGGFYVADDGAGIPESDRDRVLESGFSTAEGGTGFGLSIVSDIAEAHGWEVGVTASESGGAQFELTGITLLEEDAAAG